MVMSKQLRILAAASLVAFMAVPAIAEKSKGVDGKKAGKAAGPKDIAADCAPPAASTELSLNNVRTTIHTGGDMWWDLLGTPRYEVPKGGGVHALFSGSLWMGGTDVNNQLKLAAMRFRQDGFDFWPGPLSTVTAEIDPATCAAYDKFFRITRPEVDKFVAWYLCKEDPDCDENVDHSGYTVPASILNWPAHGDISMGQDYNLAPYYDADGSGSYNPEEGGDYPYYDLNPTEFNCLREREVKLFGDETFWWVFNDKGNIHTESGGTAIGMEVRGQAFAFSTNDEINDMTFYNYELINRGSFTLANTYFAQWVDPDLGYAQDDYVGCDVRRGLGYCYNGSPVDGTGGPLQYGANPPAIGVDFFQGPYQDNDGVDNPLYTNCEVSQAFTEGGIVYRGIGVGYGDGIADNERFGMRRFVYHNNDATVQGDPSSAAEHYNYMRGIWRDNNPMCYGGNGHPNSGCNVGVPAGYMFPGDSDPCGWGTGGSIEAIWTEQTANNPPNDRRFMQSAGPFTLESGAVNDITVGVVWARATNASDPYASVDKLRLVDDKAQALFDNCFVLIDGPDAPDVDIIELDRELVLLISNPSTSNNADEDYAQIDPFIVSPDTVTWDNVYRFEGYQIFQLKNLTVSSSDLQNPDVARLVAQCDIKNIDPLTNEPIAQLVNFTFSEELNASVPVEMVNGANEGLKHSFSITQDLFATGDRRLVNHKTYYYMAVAYAYNNYKQYNQNDPLALDGQKKPYLAGRKNAQGGAIQANTGIPHKLAPEQEGTIVSVNYGDGPRLTRIEGQGNGSRDLKLSQKTLHDIVVSSDNRVKEVTYDYGRGPVDIKVIDPKNVPLADFVFRMHDTITPGNLADAYWSLECIGEGCTQIAGSNTVYADKPIGLQNGDEKLIPEWGLSVFLEQTIDPGNEEAGMGLIDSRIEFSGTNFWLTGVPDVDGVSPLNWIRSGSVAPNEPPTGDEDYGDVNQVYETVLNGTWAPYKLASHKDGVMSPTWSQFKALNDLKNLAGVDLIITADQSKWSRCPVFEVADESVPRIGDAKRFNLRMSPSVDKNGAPDGSGTFGMSWFPGYAVNVETGERLNIAFGESSWLLQENGGDMIWNPTGNVTDDNFDFQTQFGNVLFGGGHYIYIFGHNGDNAGNDVPAYDEGQFIFNKLSENNYNPTNAEKRRVYKDCMWVGLPLLAEGGRLLASDVKVEVRVTKPFRSDMAVGWSELQPENDNLPMYTFTTGDFATVRGDLATAESALDLIRAVPNPYYAHSGYERTQLDNIVKIINLPDVCTVRIYTVNGILVREIKKDSPITSVDWDLKNHKAIPIASGVYLIHVEAPGIGEKVIKWFGTVRQLDLDSF